MFHKHPTMLMAGVALSALALAVRAADDSAGGQDLMGEFSLADLIGIDVSDVEEIRSSSLKAGLYEFEVTKADSVDGVDKDELKRAVTTFELKVVEVIGLMDKQADPTSFVDRKHSENFYIPFEKGQEDMAAAIGRVRAFITDMGGDSAGSYGNIVANAVGLRFKGRIVEQPAKGDPSTKYARLKLDPPKAQR